MCKCIGCQPVKMDELGPISKTVGLFNPVHPHPPVLSRVAAGAILDERASARGVRADPVSVHGLEFVGKLDDGPDALGVPVSGRIVRKVVVDVDLQRGHLQQLEEREAEPVVPGLVVKLEFPVEIRC